VVFCRVDAWHGLIARPAARPGPTGAVFKEPAAQAPKHIQPGHVLVRLKYPEGPRKPDM
jgi:hypothetical protein